jgi:acyl-CoA-binding protein
MVYFNFKQQAAGDLQGKKVAFLYMAYAFRFADYIGLADSSLKANPADFPKAKAK